MWLWLEETITPVPVASGGVCLLGFAVEGETGLLHEPQGSAHLHSVRFFPVEIAEEKPTGLSLSRLSAFASGALL